ncbi:MAG: VanZ family protein [Burkholderiaceae bacterium]|nr:VanZ family protein [Burkholderiaceae bacterium]
MSRRRVLLAVCLLLVLHGSLYPWRFDPSVRLAQGWTTMWAQADVWTSLGDVAGNLVLFVPVGWLALRAWPRRQPVGPMSWLAIWLVGVAYAMALQVLQIWVPQRTPSVSDALWNAMGMALGQLAAGAATRLRPHAADRAVDGATPAGLMALLWLAIEWWPFVPTIDWQHMKNALKPLLLSPQWHALSFVAVALGVVVLAQIGRAWPHRALLLTGMVTAAALGKLFLRGQSISLPHAMGWLAGLGLAGAVVWRVDGRRAAALVLCLAFGIFTFDELRPFAWTELPTRFSWIPFVSSLRGSMVANTLALCWQLFWLGAVMLAGRALGWRPGVLALALAGWAFVLEWQQAWLPGRVADITPAVLPLLWWLALPGRRSAPEPGTQAEQPHGA